MIYIEQKDGQLFGVVKHPTGRINRVDISIFRLLNEADRNRFLNPIISRFSLNNSKTATSKLHLLTWIGAALSHQNISELPHSDDGWQRFVLSIHRFIFTRADSKASLKTRNSQIWLNTKKLLEDLQDDGLIPISVFIPRLRETLENVDISHYTSRLIGEHSPIVADGTVDKLLIPISLARSDAEYLDEVRNALSEKRRILHDVLCDYFYKIRDNYRFGKKLIDSVDWPTLKQQIELYLKSSPRSFHQNHPANPATSLANYLSVIHNELNNLPIGQHSIFKMETQWIPFKYGNSSDWIKKNNEFPGDFDSKFKFSHLQSINWMLGNLSHMDVGFITALLIMLNPKYTPYSLMLARLYDKNGKMYIEIKEDGSLLFSVEKSRAKSMKTEALDELSQEIIRLVIEMSEPIRNELKKVNDPKASLLFLPIVPSSNKMGSVNVHKASAYLSGPDNALNGRTTWLGTLYPQIIDSGLGPGTISLSKIRNSEGVLEWFRTGSIKAVSRKLGNSRKTVLDHYIPKALLVAWNTRMVRKFQNLWLTVAAADEDYLLDITDFHTLGDLHSFLINMLTDHPSTSSPLATELHDRFSRLVFEQANNGTVPQPNSTLSVSISRNSLAALYLYSNAVQSAGVSNNVLARIDPQTSLSPNHFIDLALMLMGSLPDHKDPQFREMHFKAIDLANAKSDSIKWLDFLLEKEKTYA